MKGRQVRWNPIGRARLNARGTALMPRPTFVNFACPACNQVYRATQERFAYVRPGRFDCIECNAEVYAWRSHCDYTGWQAVASKRSER